MLGVGACYGAVLRCAAEALPMYGNCMSRTVRSGLVPLLFLDTLCSSALHLHWLQVPGVWCCDLAMTRTGKVVGDTANGTFFDYAAGAGAGA